MITNIDIQGLYWAIPTSDMSHRSEVQTEKIRKFCKLPKEDLRSCYYHIAFTNKEAIFKISSCFPVIDKYIDHSYMVKGNPLILKNNKTVSQIGYKLKRILAFENAQKNYFTQKITSIKEMMLKELELVKKADGGYGGTGNKPQSVIGMKTPEKIKKVVPDVLLAIDTVSEIKEETEVETEIQDNEIQGNQEVDFLEER